MSSMTIDRASSRAPGGVGGVYGAGGDARAEDAAVHDAAVLVADDLHGDLGHGLHCRGVAISNRRSSEMS